MRNRMYISMMSFYNGSCQIINDGVDLHQNILLFFVYNSNLPPTWAFFHKEQYTFSLLTITFNLVIKVCWYYLSLLARNWRTQQPWKLRRNTGVCRPRTSWRIFTELKWRRRKWFFFTNFIILLLLFTQLNNTNVS